MIGIDVSRTSTALHTALVMTGAAAIIVWLPVRSTDASFPGADTGSSPVRHAFGLHMQGLFLDLA